MKHRPLLGSWLDLRATHSERAVPAPWNSYEPKSYAYNNQYEGKGHPTRMRFERTVKDDGERNAARCEQQAHAPKDHWAADDLPGGWLRHRTSNCAMRLPCVALTLSQRRRTSCCLTFDMSGGPKGAKRPLERPLDGGVRPHRGTFGCAACQREDKHAAVRMRQMCSTRGYECTTATFCGWLKNVHVPTRPLRTTPSSRMPGSKSSGSGVAPCRQCARRTIGLSLARLRPSGTRRHSRGMRTQG